MMESAIEEAVDRIRRRRMILPAILLVAGHRPLAFAIGQLLLVLHPVAALFGTDGLLVWAELLSRPAGPSALTERLAHALEEEGRPLPRRKVEL